MPQIALTTFLKLWPLGPTQKEAAYRRYLSPGGYDYYWSMKAGAAVLMRGGTLEEALAVLDGLSRETERKNNESGIRALAELLSDLKGERFEAPQRPVPSPLGRLAIKVAPELGIALKGSRRRLVTLWNTKSPDMTTELAAVGTCLMFDAVALDEFRDCACAIYDLRQKRWHIADAASATMRLAVRRELAWVDSLFEKFADEKAARTTTRPEPPSPETV